MENIFLYKTKKILIAIFSWELIFWILFSMFLFVMDFFSSSNKENHLTFKFPEQLFLIFLVLPVLIIAFSWFMYWKNKKLSRIGGVNTLKTLLKPIHSKHYFISYFLLRNAIVFILIAMAQPVFGSKKVNASLDTMELVLAIDVSNSMNTRDIDPETSRLEIVKRAMIQLINNFHGEKVGICVFAGGAYIQLPITADYEAAKMYVNEIETNMLSNQGTNISAALNVSKEMFSKEKTSKAILIVSDGENHEGQLEEASKTIKESEIMLAVLGIGTKNGGYIPNDPQKPELGYKIDAKGTKIRSKLNENLLRQIAKKTDGFYTISYSPFPNLSQILTQFSQIKRTKIETITLDIKENWYQIPLFFGIIFFLLFSLFKQNLFLIYK
jgi:Ca-activated chloride channel family protein